MHVNQAIFLILLFTCNNLSSGISSDLILFTRSILPGIALSSLFSCIYTFLCENNYIFFYNKFDNCNSISVLSFPIFCSISLDACNHNGLACAASLYPSSVRCSFRLRTPDSEVSLIRFLASKGFNVRTSVVLSISTAFARALTLHPSMCFKWLRRQY